MLEWTGRVPQAGENLGSAARFARWRNRCAALDWAPDLAEDIGSRRWFRGLATMLTLSAAALGFWPDLSALEAAPTSAIDATSRDEFRSQLILPLALGGDSGRHMGATQRVKPLADAPERPTLQMTATLGQGDSFGRMLERAGVGSGDAAQVAALVAHEVALTEIVPGTRIDILLGQRTGANSARPVEKIAFRARFDLNLAIVRGPGGLLAERHTIAVDATPLRIRGTVGASLYRSARAAGAPIEAIQQYLQTINQHLSLDTDIQPQDTFDIVIAYKRSGSGEAEVGDLLYAGLERGGKAQAELLRWGREGQFFEASGMGQQRTGLIMPVVGGRITSNFGMRRHPVLGYTRLHGGVDFGAPYGAPIFAVGDGTVAFAGWHGGHGNFVKLEHGGGYGTGYAHMSRIAVGVGTRVRAGQVIGYVGSTGLSTGPHLHYELYQSGQRVNPMSVRFTVSNSVDESELSAFRARLTALRTIQPGAALISLAPRQAGRPTDAAGREIDKLD